MTRYHEPQAPKVPTLADDTDMPDGERPSFLAARIAAARPEIPPDQLDEIRAAVAEALAACGDADDGEAIPGRRRLLAMRAAAATALRLSPHAPEGGSRGYVVHPSIRGGVPHDVVLLLAVMETIGEHGEDAAAYPPEDAAGFLSTVATVQAPGLAYSELLVIAYNHMGLILESAGRVLADGRYAKGDLPGTYAYMAALRGIVQHASSWTAGTDIRPLTRARWFMRHFIMRERNAYSLTAAGRRRMETIRLP